MAEKSRRRFVQGTGATLAAALAGCSGAGGSGGGESGESNKVGYGDFQTTV
jgi:hypothetical protein